MKRLKTLNELFFDNSELDDGKVRFYLTNPKTNKGFAFDCDREDKEQLEEIFKRNNVVHEVDDGGNELPF